MDSIADIFVWDSVLLAEEKVNDENVHHPYLFHNHDYDASFVSELFLKIL